MYVTLKLLHLIFVIAFLGNITTGLFWHRHAQRTRDPRLLAHTMDGIIRSDRWFTLPGVVGIVAAGLGLAKLGGLPLLRTDWILATLILFVVSGVVFGLRVAPLQRALRALAQQGAQRESFDYGAYAALAWRWEWWGAISLLTPFLGLGLMVFKPTW